jgi:hypothetical protein
MKKLSLILLLFLGFGFSSCSLFEKTDIESIRAKSNQASTFPNSEKIAKEIWNDRLEDAISESAELGKHYLKIILVGVDVRTISREEKKVYGGFTESRQCLLDYKDLKSKLTALLNKKNYEVADSNKAYCEILISWMSPLDKNNLAKAYSIQESDLFRYLLEDVGGIAPRFITKGDSESLAYDPLKAIQTINDITIIEYIVSDTQIHSDGIRGMVLLGFQ